MLSDASVAFQEAARKSKKPVWIAEIEHSEDRHIVTSFDDWDAATTKTRVDINTILGSVLIASESSEVDIMDTTVNAELFCNGTYGSFDTDFGIRLRPIFDVTLKNIRLSVTFEAGSTLGVTATLYKVDPADEYVQGASDKGAVLKTDQVLGTDSFTHTAGISNFEDADFDFSSIRLKAGEIYYIFFDVTIGGAVNTGTPSTSGRMVLEDSGSDFDHSWPDASKPVDYLADKTDADHELGGQLVKWLTVVTGALETVSSSSEQVEVKWVQMYDETSGSADYTAYSDEEFIRQPIIKLTVDAFDDGLIETDWLPVKDPDGNNTTPTENGRFFKDAVIPLGSDITVEMRGADDAIGTGNTLIGSDMQDGDEITTLKAYYKYEATLSNTTPADSHFQTPELRSLGAIFPSVTKFSRHDIPKFCRNLIAAVPAISSRLQNIQTMQSSFDEVEILLQNWDPMISKLEDIEQIHIQSKTIFHELFSKRWPNGKEMRLKYGFEEIGEAEFVQMARAIINDYSVDWDGIFRLTGNNGFFNTGEQTISIVDTNSIKGMLYDHEAPTDILLDYLYRSGMPGREINVSSFDTYKASDLDGWQFIVRLGESVDDVKRKISEIARLTLGAPITLEDGQTHYIQFDDDTKEIVADFTLDNSRLEGAIRLNLNSRIPVCRVWTGWYDAIFNEKDTPTTSETAVDGDSIVALGPWPTKVLDTKMVPDDVTISGDSLGKVIAQKQIDAFSFGQWMQKVSAYFPEVQVGDNVRVELPFLHIPDHVYLLRPRLRGVVVDKDINADDEIKFDVWFYKGLDSLEIET